MKYTSFIILAAIATSANSAPIVNGGNVSFASSTWWQIEIPWDQGGGVVCDSGSDPSGCFLNEGRYKWVQGSESGSFTVSSLVAAPVQSVSSVTYHTSSVDAIWQGSEDPSQHTVSCDQGHIMATACVITASEIPEVWIRSHWSTLDEDGYTCGADSYEQPPLTSSPQTLNITITYSCLVD